MKNIIIIIGVVALAILGVKFYAEHKYKEELDQAIRNAQPFASVAYDDLSIGFDGVISITGLSFQPPDEYESIRIGEIAIDAHDPLFPLFGEKRIRNGEYPERFDIKLTQASMPISLIKPVTQSQECRSLEGLFDYSNAGYDNLELNAAITINTEDINNASMEMNFFGQIFSGSIEMDFNGGAVSPVALASGVNPLTRLQYSASLEETQMVELVSYCAEKFNISGEDYLNKVVASRKFFINSFEHDFGEAARQGMVDFVRGGKELVVTLTPSDRLMRLLMASQGDMSGMQILRLMNPNVTLEGDKIPLQFYQANRSVDSEADEPDQSEDDSDETVPAETASAEAVPQPAAKSNKPRYVMGSLSNANEYINQYVRIKRTKGRSLIEGRLVGNQQGVLAVEIYRYGGKAVYKIPFGEVAKLQVEQR